jgi:hypothetical protein
VVANRKNLKWGKIKVENKKEKGRNIKEKGNIKLNSKTVKKMS